MLRLRPLAVAILVVSVAALTFGGIASAAPIHRSMARMDHLTVRITATGGTVWGTVTVSYGPKGHVKMVGMCAKASCAFKVPNKAKVHLKEKATSSSTWPFAGWSIKDGKKHLIGMADKITFKITARNARATATYKVA